MSKPLPAEISELLRRHGQDHLERRHDSLADNARAAFASQLREIDIPQVQQLYESLQATEVGGNEGETAASRAARAAPPSQVIRLPRAADEQSAWNHAAQIGHELLRAGKVGVVLVAGGQGTRLGFSQPKGMFPIGPVSENSLYQLLAEQVVARGRQSGVRIPYFVMTSDATHEATVAFFEEHGRFGLERDDVFFFRQGVMPAVDARTGRILLSEEGMISTSPDGHGGLLAALDNAKLFDEMRSRGIDYLYYHQVDNPTAIVCDPALLGWHALRQADVSTKVVAKRSAEERMGLVAEVDRKTCIIEYSDLPEDIARQTDDEGRLRHWAGNTAIHVFSRAFLEQIAHQAGGLPFHAARKKVLHLDETGRVVDPSEPNAIKFERFIFDVLPLTERALVVEGDREREFNPVKNDTGADSPETARQALSAIHRGWLRQAGAQVDDQIPVEISPLAALDAEQVRARIAPGTKYSTPLYLHGTR